ncbi:hypothetical protein [Streptomyces sp. NPDC059918]|uniref:hypothetical protein n=1 Tax=unclassified Streptomyces TaxID=2593676 RepID=UPI0036466CE6
MSIMDFFSQPAPAPKPLPPDSPFAKIAELMVDDKAWDAKGQELTQRLVEAVGTAREEAVTTASRGMTAYLGRLPKGQRCPGGVKFLAVLEGYWQTRSTRSALLMEFLGKHDVPDAVFRLLKTHAGTFELIEKAHREGVRYGGASRKTGETYSDMERKLVYIAPTEDAGEFLDALLFEINNVLRSPEFDKVKNAYRGDTPSEARAGEFAHKVAEFEVGTSDETAEAWLKIRRETSWKGTEKQGSRSLTRTVGERRRRTKDHLDRVLGNSDGVTIGEAYRGMYYGMLALHAQEELKTVESQDGRAHLDAVIEFCEEQVVSVGRRMKLQQNREEPKDA